MVSGLEEIRERLVVERRLENARRLRYESTAEGFSLRRAIGSMSKADRVRQSRAVTVPIRRHFQIPAQSCSSPCRLLRPSLFLFGQKIVLVENTKIGPSL